MERRFCCAKSVACGRVIEREWGNPQRFPPHTPPSLRYARVRTTKPEGNHKKKNHPLGGFSFWNAADRMELAASTSAKRVKSRGEGRTPANGSAIRGMPGSEFEPRLFCCAEREKKRKTALWAVSVCQKSLSLRASPRREASALGVHTGVAIRFQNA